MHEFQKNNTGKSVCRSIVWQDMRTADRVAAFNEKFEGSLYTKLGSTAFTNSTAPKVEWIMEHNEEVRKGIEEGNILYGWIDTWLIWKLSGGKAHVTDSSNLAGTLLGDYSKVDYNKAMLEEFHIPREILPKVVITGQFSVDTDPDVFFGHAVPIAASAGDQTASAVGQACIKPGMIKNTYGTGSFMVLNTGKVFPENVPSTSGLFLETANDIGPELHYALEGFANVSGSAIQWLRDGTGMIENAKEAEELANSVEDNGGVYFVPAFAGLPNGTDPYARGTIIGLTRGSTKAHICRAAIEAMAYQVAESFEAMAAYAGVEIQAVRADGGGSDSDIIPLDALLGIHAAVNQPYPENSVTPYEAVRMYTSDGARCGWEDDKKGKLVGGMQADMVILDADPMTVNSQTIKDITVLGTIRKGELVYNNGLK